MHRSSAHIRLVEGFLAFMLATAFSLLAPHVALAVDNEAAEGVQLGMAAQSASIFATDADGATEAQDRLQDAVAAASLAASQDGQREEPANGVAADASASIKDVSAGAADTLADAADVSAGAPDAEDGAASGEVADDDIDARESEGAGAQDANASGDDDTAVLTPGSADGAEGDDAHTAESNTVGEAETSDVHSAGPSSVDGTEDGDAAYGAEPSLGGEADNGDPSEEDSAAGRTDAASAETAGAAERTNAASEETADVAGAATAGGDTRNASSPTGVAQAPQGTSQDSQGSQAATQKAYVEGEAIAIVRSGAALPRGATAQVLITVSADSLKLALEGMAGSSSTLVQQVAQRMPSAAGKSFDIVRVRDASRTAEQLLSALLASPNVIGAERNSLVSAHKALWGDADAPSAQSSGTSDLTPMQWYTGGSSSSHPTPLAPTGGYSLNVPGWSEGRTDANAPANASGTICICDTGIDVTHPDLQGVLFEFTPEQQAKYGCGRYGYNASGEDDLTDVTDFSGHGTHVAGIVAAQWNGFGTSGVANGVKIFAVRIFGNNGQSMTESSLIEGFRFLVNVATEVNLKAINCSWGNVETQYILTVLVNELGKKGVNTVFASGNRYCDLDETIDTGGQINSPYAITVNSVNADGTVSDFTCWGQTSTDVFSTGASIISTVPQTITITNGGVVWSHAEGSRFYPEATPAENLTSTMGIERFDGSTSAVRCFDSNPAMGSANEIGKVATGVGFDDTSSMAFNIKSLRETASRMGKQGTAVNGSVYLAIPVSSTQDALWVGAKCAVSDAFKPAGGIVSVTCVNDAGELVQLDAFAISVLNGGWANGALTTLYWSQWSPLSFNVAAYIAASNELRTKVSGYSYIEKIDLGLLDYVDPGHISGVYLWQDGGRLYLIAEVGVGRGPIDNLQDTTMLYIDNVAVGGKDAWRGAYSYMSGTSMATPCVSGCLGVIAKDERENSTYSSSELEMLALQRAAKLLASVQYDESLSTLCRTGGRVDLSQNPGFTQLAPIIARAEADESTLSIAGYFFGDAGKLFIDDVAVKAASWATGKITASVRGLVNGSHVAKVVNSSGAISRIIFSYFSEDADGRKLYENTLSLPLDQPGYVDDDTDLLYGDMVMLDGYAYAFSTHVQGNTGVALWRYDVAADSWTRCADMPASFGCEGWPGYMTALDGKIYVFGSYTISEEENEPRLWSFDPAKGSWTLLDVKVPPSGNIVALGGKIFLLNTGYFEYGAAAGGSGHGWAYGLNAGSGDKDADDEGDDDSGDDEQVSFAMVDPVALTVTALSGALPEDDGLNYSMSRAVASEDKVYLYVSRDTKKGRSALFRLTFDAANLAMVVEDITDALEAALGGDLYPAFNNDYTGYDNEHYIAIAGLPHGVAIIGSTKRGQDTHTISDGATTAKAYGRTSCYHEAYTPLAVYGDGFLYAMGYSATEPDVMYFRSTHIEHVWDDGVVTHQPTCTQPGVRTFTCAICGITRTESIPALGHSWGEWTTTQDPTCTAEGVQTRICGNDPSHVQTRPVPALGHQWDEGVVTRQPTYDEEGEITYTCLICGETRTEPIAKLVRPADGVPAKAIAITRVTAAPAEYDVTPQTGDSAPWEPFAGIAMMSLALACIAAKRMREAACRD